MTAPGWCRPASREDESALWRERCLQAREEAYSLRLDLIEALELFEIAEGELRHATLRNVPLPSWVEPGRNALATIVRARTLTRSVLVRQCEGEQGDAARRDLRIAEAAFGFLMGLRALRP